MQPDGVATCTRRWDGGGPHKHRHGRGRTSHNRSAGARCSLVPCARCSPVRLLGTGLRLVTWHVASALRVPYLTAELPWGSHRIATRRGPGTRAMYVWRNYSPHETAAFRQVVRAGDVVWDVGAHVGALSTLAASLAGPAGEVVAFEPDPQAALLCRRNLEAWANASLEQVALSSHHGRRALRDSPHAGSRGFYGEGSVVADVLTWRGDDVAARRGRPDVVKIDTEGHELAVLDGMGDLLGEVRVFLVECHGQERQEAVEAILGAAGYATVPVVSPWKATSSWLLGQLPGVGRSVERETVRSQISR